MISEYFTYLLILNVWASTAVKAKLVTESLPESFNAQALRSDTILSEISENSQDDRRGEFRQILEGFSGDWMQPYEAPAGYFACGLQMRNEASYGSDYDNQYNSLRIIFCHENDWYNQLAEILDVGEYEIPWGNEKKCPYGTYISGGQARTYWDVLALNGLLFVCKDPKIERSQATMGWEYYRYSPNWGFVQSRISGKWSDDFIEDTKYVCGGQVRFDPNQTNQLYALNGLKFKFCEWQTLYPGFISITEGERGSWLKPVVASSNLYACGIKVKSQPYQGNKYDDTGINAINFIFCSPGSRNEESITSIQSSYGDWQRELMCPRGAYISGLRARVVPPQGEGDDIAINDFDIKCVSSTPYGVTSILPYNLSFEGTWINMIEKDELICGSQVRIDFTEIGKGDATGLNGLRVKLCPNPFKPILGILEEGKQGTWLKSVDATTNALACGVAIKYSDEVSPNGNYPIDAIKLIYCESEWKNQSEKNINDGVKGTWKKSVLCPEYTYIYSARAKIEPINGPLGQEFVLSGVEFKCKGFSAQDTTTMIADNGGWGTWREWVEYEGKYVCGGAAKFESTQENQSGIGVFGLCLIFCRASF